MIRIVFHLFLWCTFFGLPALVVGQQPTTEEVLHWLVTNDRAAWFEAVESARAGAWNPTALMEPLNVPFLEKDHQPDWARSVDDESMWSWMRSIRQELWMHHHRPEAGLEADAVFELRKEEARGAWPLVAVAVWFFVFALALAWWRIRRYEQAVLNLNSELFPALAAAPSAEVWTDAVREQWAQLQRSDPLDRAVATGRWQLLSGPEKEVARLLAQHYPVRKIAKQMACSPSHIYNVRSSIRRKWHLANEDDLLEAIAREVVEG